MADIAWSQPWRTPADLKHQLRTRGSHFSGKHLDESLGILTQPVWIFKISFDMLPTGGQDRYQGSETTASSTLTTRRGFVAPVDWSTVCQFRLRLRDGSHAEHHFDRDWDNLGQFWRTKSFHFILLPYAGRFTISHNTCIPIASCPLRLSGLTCGAISSSRRAVFTPSTLQESHPIEPFPGSLREGRIRNRTITAIHWSQQTYGTNDGLSQYIMRLDPSDLILGACEEFRQFCGMSTLRLSS